MNRILKYASLLAAAVMLISCEGQSGDGGSLTNQTLTLASDRNLIQTFGGDYATLTVKLGDQQISEGVTFFDGKNNVLDIQDFKFTTDVAGEYEIWANYGTYNSDKITVRAISVAIPESPADPQPQNTTFKTRTLLTEFTTVGCTACPGMKNLLHAVLQNADFADKVVVTECHSGLVGGTADPCYIHTGFDDFCSITGFPTVNLDMCATFANYNLANSEFVSMVEDLIAMKEGVAAGISVNSVLSGEEVIIKAQIKAAAAGTYRVGAFLLEDGVYAEQLGGAAQSWMDTHDGVIRYIDSKYFAKTGGERYYGHSVGQLGEGETADHVFVWSLDEIWTAGSEKAETSGGGMPWVDYNIDNLHLAVFVSARCYDADGDQIELVANVIDCPISGMTPYEYR